MIRERKTFVEIYENAIEATKDIKNGQTLLGKLQGLILLEIYSSQNFDSYFSLKSVINVLVFFVYVFIKSRFQIIISNLFL